MDSTMKPGDLVKVTNRSKSDWKHQPPIVVSQFGILIEEVFVEDKVSRPWASIEAKMVPGWIISTTEEGLVRRATSKIFKVKDPADALPDLIAARNLLDKKISEIQGVDQ